MSSPSSCYTRAPDLRLRPLPEWRSLIVFTPRKPDLHWLNPEAWLVLELTDGQTFDELCAAYREQTGLGHDEARTAVTSCLETLEGKGIVERVGPAPAQGT